MIKLCFIMFLKFMHYILLSLCITHFFTDLSDARSSLNTLNVDLALAPIAKAVACHAISRLLWVHQLARNGAEWDELCGIPPTDQGRSTIGVCLSQGLRLKNVPADSMVHIPQGIPFLTVTPELSSGSAWSVSTVSSAATSSAASSKIFPPCEIDVKDLSEKIKQDMVLLSGITPKNSTQGVLSVSAQTVVQTLSTDTPGRNPFFDVLLFSCVHGCNDGGYAGSSLNRWLQTEQSVITAFAKLNPLASSGKRFYRYRGYARDKWTLILE